MDRNIFTEGIEKLGAQISDIQIGKFELYSNLLVEWNKKINLTAITDPKEISIKHFLDSILLIYNIEIKNGASLIDVGTGAGFPGIPIKIMRDDINLTLLDSLNKRVNFLKEVCTQLTLENADCIHLRAEEGGKSPRYREKFDIAVSRAVAPLFILSEYCLPYVKKGGIFIALKAYDIDGELKEAKPMIGNLGGKVIDVKSAPLPLTDIVRKLIIIEKYTDTPKQFPRNANKIKRDA